jgi:hypothetical protein
MTSPAILTFPRLLCGLLSAALAVAADPSLQSKVLIVGVDGTRPDALAVAHTPNLDALKPTGGFSDRAVTHPVTHSAACWTSMFTGVWGDKHGVNDPGNSFAGNRLDFYPNFMKRLETANSNLFTVAYTRWADLKYALDGTDIVTNYASDAALTTATCSLLTNANPDVFYTILLDVDSTGHSSGWGPTVTNYVKAIETADGRIGQMIGALTNRTTYAQEDWLVLVLSDHGQHDSTIEASRVTFHLVWGPAAARGAILPSPGIVDVCATVLTHMGSPIDPAWGLDARIEGLPLPPTRYGTNLIFNGNAEANSGTNSFTPNRGVAWWFDASSLSLGVYGSNTNFPAASSPGPADRGNNFFLGVTNGSAISQTLDVSDLAGPIDQLAVDYRLAGFFGGWGNRDDSMLLTARFLDAIGQGLATNTVGGVSAADRGDITGLLECSAGGLVPAGTRRVELTLGTQGASTSNCGLADNLSLVLDLATNSAASLLGCVVTNGTVQVTFNGRLSASHWLERSEGFSRWTALPGTVAGPSPLTLVDTNPPPGQAFYRVGSQSTTPGKAGGSN